MTCEGEDYLIVAAIDLGTTYSGVAFSSRNDFVREPTNVFVKTWTSCTGKMQIHKTSSCVLFDQDMTFQKFGFEAEEKYSELLLDGDSENWYFFRRFKMFLYNTEAISDETLMVSENGKAMPAISVFSASLRYLKEQVWEEFQKQLSSPTETDIKWVITVPAIWTQPAKAFVRSAAIQAGIDCKRLSLVLEPEAAAVLLKNLPMEKRASGQLGDIFQTFLPGSKYLVVDAGGGTVDITAHEILEDGKVKEIFRSSGGNWGGTQVDKEFLSFIQTIVGDDVMEAFIEKHRTEMFDLESDIQLSKQAITPTIGNKVKLSLPAELFSIYESKHPESDLRFITEYTLKNGEKARFSWAKNKIRFDYSLARSFFEDSVASIINHLESLLDKEQTSGIDTILMVGGYSDSPVLFDAMKKQFPDKRILVPKEASWSVLQGAVIFGHDSSLIKQRKSKYTYGVKCKKVFKEGVHDENKKVMENGRAMCSDIFSKHVEIDDLITVGEYQTDKLYRVSHEAKSNFEVYASVDRNPMYTTEKGCFKIGELHIDNKGVEVGSKTRVKMSFSQTEIQVNMTHRRTHDSTNFYLGFDSFKN